MTRIDNGYVLTGGPGSGKTSVIAALRERGFRCVDEAGRAIIRQQRAIGGNALHWGDREMFRELMLARSMDDHEAAAGSAGPVFFDRGIPELIGYCRLIGVAVPAHVRKAAELFRYNRTVFVAPPWPEIYRNDAERKQDFAEAVATFEAVAGSYRECGYETVALPKASVGERVAFMLAAVGLAAA